MHDLGIRAADEGAQDGANVSYEHREATDGGEVVLGSCQEARVRIHERRRPKLMGHCAPG